MFRRLLALVVAAALAGCGGSPGGSGTEGSASVWVTRDNGATVVLSAEVPAGLTVMQALDRVADIETRYGGRYVQAIEGIAGSLSEQRDWFYFLNGVEPDVGAAEVRMRPGDIAWWDFRGWTGTPEQPVVVGAFPEPLRAGFAGVVRRLTMEAPPQLADAADALLSAIGRPDATGGQANAFELVIEAGATGATLTATRGPANDDPVTFRLAGSEGAVRAAALALAADPTIVRYHYSARFDESGTVVG